jgi:hypothetical protein
MEEAINRDKKAKQDIADTFIDYFSSQGYVVTSPVQFITDDKSVLFTNATIIPWKRYVLGEAIPKEGVCMQQPCLRLHTLNDPIQTGVNYETSFNRFLGYFNMVGLLTKPENGERLAEEVMRLLVEGYNITKERISVLSSKKDNLIKTLEGKVNIEYDTKKESFYHWDYGINGIHGRGATFCLRQEDGKLREIGQIIKINGSDSLETFEFGFGIETFLSRAQSRQDYSAWTIYHCLPSEYRFKTLLDLTSCLGVTSTISPDLITSKHNKEILRLAKRIALAEKVFNISPEILEESINKFINTEFNQDTREYVHSNLNKAREEI